MRKSRILILSLFAPVFPLDGGSVRTYDVLKALSPVFDVYFLGTYNPKVDSLQKIQADLSALDIQFSLAELTIPTGAWSRKSILLDLVRFPPPRIKKYLSADYQTKTHQLLETNFDLVVSNTILAGQVLAHEQTPIPKILDMVDLFSLMREREYKNEKSKKFKKMYLYLDAIKTKYYERRIWNIFNGFIAISEPDRITVSNCYPNKPVALIPISMKLPDLVAQKKKYDLVFVGKLNYPPNIDALSYFDTKIMPILLQHRPDLSVAIVGKDPDIQIRQIVGEQPRFHLFENVPDVNPYYSQSRIVIIPIKTGSGIKVKLIEALSSGIPVVSTSIGAYGIPVENQRHLLIADTPADFGDAVIRLLDDQSLSNRLAAEARKLVESNYAWDLVKVSYVSFIDSFVEKPDRRVI